jgi:hypothetical protein
MFSLYELRSVWSFEVSAVWSDMAPVLVGVPLAALSISCLDPAQLEMCRKGWDYEQVKKFGSHAGQLGNRDGVQQNTE